MVTLSLESNGINFGLILSGKMIYVERIKDKKDRELNHRLLKLKIKMRLKEIGLLRESIIRVCPICRTNVKLEEVKFDDNNLINNTNVITYVRQRDAVLFTGVCKVCN